MNALSRAAGSFLLGGIGFLGFKTNGNHKKCQELNDKTESLKARIESAKILQKAAITFDDPYGLIESTEAMIDSHSVLNEVEKQKKQYSCSSTSDNNLSTKKVTHESYSEGIINIHTLVACHLNSSKTCKFIVQHSLNICEQLPAEITQTIKDIEFDKDLEAKEPPQFANISKDSKRAVLNSYEPVLVEVAKELAAIGQKLKICQESQNSPCNIKEINTALEQTSNKIMTLSDRQIQDGRDILKKAKEVHGQAKSLADWSDLHNVSDHRRVQSRLEIFKGLGVVNGGQKVSEFSDKLVESHNAFKCALLNQEQNRTDSRG